MAVFLHNISDTDFWCELGEGDYTDDPLGFGPIVETDEGMRVRACITFLPEKGDFYSYKDTKTDIVIQKNGKLLAYINKHAIYEMQNNPNVVMSRPQLPSSPSDYSNFISLF